MKRIHIILSIGLVIVKSEYATHLMVQIYWHEQLQMVGDTISEKQYDQFFHP